MVLSSEKLAFPNISYFTSRPSEGPLKVPVPYYVFVCFPPLCLLLYASCQAGAACMEDERNTILERWGDDNDGLPYQEKALDMQSFYVGFFMMPLHHPTPKDSMCNPDFLCAANHIPENFLGSYYSLCS